MSSPMLCWNLENEPQIFGVCCHLSAGALRILNVPFLHLIFFCIALVNADCMPLLALASAGMPLGLLPLLVPRAKLK